MSSTSRSGRKGQPSLEFMAMISLALLMFAGFYSFFVVRQGVAFEQQRLNIASEMADSVSFQLDLALIEGDGFSRSFTLRPTIAGASYNVTVESGIVVIGYLDRTVISSTAVRDLHGDVKPGKNRVRNKDGNITVAQP